jgi:23S rRNA (uracil1939-C5)-methyltransferase
VSARPGDSIEATITDLALEGRGVARAGGLVLFVHGALPGERVRLTIERVRRAFAEGTTTAVLAPSPDRVRPPCPHYDSCGGCDLQHLATAAQAEAKRRQVAAVLRRIAGLGEVDVRPTVPAPDPLGYRFRMDFDWRPGASGPILGLHRRGRAGEVVPIDRCLLAGDHTAAIVRAAPSEAARLHLGAWDPRRRRGLLRRLSIQEARGTREVLVTIESGRGHDPAMAEFAAVLARRFPRLVGIVRRETGPEGRLHGSSILHGRDYLHEELEGDRWRIPSEAFFQPNPAGGLLLRSHAIAACNLAPGAALLELYAGVGFFTVAAARAGARVVAVEGGAAACAAGRDNTRSFGGACRFVNDDVGVALPGLLAEEWDAVLLDPPRSGLAPDAVRALVAARTRRLVYVSCDPGTLARDLGLLVRAGNWRLDSVQPFDLFPQTQHVEAVAVLGPR